MPSTDMSRSSSEHSSKSGNSGWSGDRSFSSTVSHAGSSNSSATRNSKPMVSVHNYGGIRHTESEAPSPPVNTPRKEPERKHRQN